MNIPENEKFYKGSFHIDEVNSDEEYLYVEVKDRGTVAIKREEEGIVIDVFPFQVVDEPVATTWAHLNDLFPEEVEES